MRKAVKAFQTSTPVSHDHEVMVLVWERLNLYAVNLHSTLRRLDMRAEMKR
jgi:hypothetical protein